MNMKRIAFLWGSWLDAVDLQANSFICVYSMGEDFGMFYFIYRFNLEALCLCP